MNKRKKRYCTLGTIAEVQKERAKLARMMKANDTHLRQDWDEISYWLSPSNIRDEVICRASTASPFIANIVAGARTAIRMIRDRREAKCGCM